MTPDPAHPSKPPKPDAPQPPLGSAAGAMSFSGTLSFMNASADVGLGIQRADGSLLLTIDRPPGENADPMFDATFDARSLAVAGLPLTNAHARVVSGSTPGQIVFPACDADLFGGRLAY